MPPPKGIGSVRAVYQGPDVADLYVRFSDAPFGACPFPQKIGTCWVVDCEQPDPIPDVDAGDITLTGPGGAVTISNANNSGNYVTISADGLFQVGDVVGFSGAGSLDIAAFETQTVAPPPITVLQPILSELKTIDVHQDLAIAWTGGGRADVVVGITLYKKNFFGLECSWPAQLGAGVIPAEALVHLPVGEQAQVWIRPEGTETVLVDGWEVHTGVLNLEVLHDASLVTIQ